MTTSPDQPIASGNAAREPIEDRLDSLADYVNAIDGNLNHLIGVVEQLNVLNSKVTDAMTGLIHQIEALHARLDDHRRHNRQIDDRYGVQSAQLVSIETLLGRTRHHVANLLTDVEQLKNPPLNIDLRDQRVIETQFGPQVVEFDTPQWEPDEETTFTCHAGVDDECTTPHQFCETHDALDDQESAMDAIKRLSPSGLTLLSDPVEAALDEAIRIQELNQDPPDAHLEADYDDRNGDPDA